MSAEVEDKSRVFEVLQTLEALATTHLEVGIFGDTDGEVVIYAAANEFGAFNGRIRERSFLRAGFDQYHQEINDTADKLIDQVMSGTLNVDAYYQIIGNFLVGKIQEFMTNLKLPANAPSTVARKGSSNPLIDTGRMRDSITWRVVSR